MFAYETICGRGARLGRANGFDMMRHLLALGIVIAHGYVLATGDLVAATLRWHGIKNPLREIVARLRGLSPAVAR